MAEKERIIKDFLELSAIDSVSFKEREFADVLKQKLELLGIKAHEDSASEKIGSTAGNVYAFWKGEENLPKILLSAHMDTVEPGIGKKAIYDTKKGILRSDGKPLDKADDIAGITEILEAIQQIQESGRKHKSVELLFPVAEEVYTKGSSSFDYTRLSAKEAYCLDLSGHVGAAAIKAPTLISFRITIHGKASHAGFAPEKGVNAIEIAAKAIAGIKQGQVDEDSTLNIGTIKGGTATNIVSEEVKIEGEIRSFKHESALKLLEDTKFKFEEEAIRLGAGITGIDFKSEIHLIAYERNEDEEVVKNFRTAAKKTGIEPKLISTMGGADNHQINKNGIKGIVLSCGMQNVHTTEEYIEIADLEAGAGLVAELIAAE